MGVDLSSDFFANIQRLQLPPRAADPPAPTASMASGSPKKKIVGEFLKGPIPLTWLSSAARLPGKSPLAVGLAIWFEAGRRRSKEFILTTAILARFNVGRKAKYRGLDALEDAGLIRVYRKPRRNPVVTILDGESPSLAQASRDVTDVDGAASDP